MGEKKKFKLSEILIIAICTIIGGIFGARIGTLAVKLGSNNLFISLFFLLAMMYIAFVVQMFLHEFGHYFFGKFTGYTLVSFRIFSIVFIRDNGRIVVKRLKLAGTGGQCIMSPPKDKTPYVLYNMGGSILNAVVAAGCYALSIVYGESSYAYTIFITLFGMGIVFALANGIPIRMKGLPNDGHNALSLSKNKKALKAFYIQLWVNAGIIQGQRIKDMPPEWFEIKGDEDKSIPLVCSNIVNAGAYWQDKHDFAKAREIFEMILQSDALISIYRNEINCELLFYELISGADKEKVENQYTQELKAYIKVTSGYPTRSRLMYAYHLLYERDEAKASEALEAFEKNVKTTPHKGEIEGERELIEIVQNIYLSLKSNLQ